MTKTFKIPFLKYCVAYVSCTQTVLYIYSATVQVEFYINIYWNLKYLHWNC